MTGRLIVVSNRLPKAGPPSGGLVVALHAAMVETNGLWIGAGEPQADPVDEGVAELTTLGTTPYQRRTFPLSEAEHEGYYLGYSNSVLWPLFHRRSDLIDIQPEHSMIYDAVNDRVARLIAEELEPEDIIWVHDYHFLPLAWKLRSLGVANRIGFFLHIPFPSPADIPALPEADDLPIWLSGYDLLGFQTTRDVGACREFLRMSGQAQPLNDGSMFVNGRSVVALAFPIGIDARSFAADALDSDAAERLATRPDTPLIIGVDRLDYSKGIVQRTDAFSAFLDRRKPGDPRPSFLQISPSSREDVEAYAEIRAEVEQAAGAINGTHADLDWIPMRFVRRHIERSTLAGLYRMARVALVTPLADGMNLVAKEFVAAQDPQDPGVLILSHFAGASEQLQDALLVNPYDTDEMAQAIATALLMPLDERCARHAALARSVFEQDNHWWQESFLAELRQAALTPPDRMSA